MKNIWHIEIKTQGNISHSLYLTRKGLFLDNIEDIRIGEFTLDRHDWSKPYVQDESPNMVLIITKRVAPSTNEVRKYIEAQKELE